MTGADFFHGDSLFVVGDLRLQYLRDFIRFDRSHPRSYSEIIRARKAIQLRAHRPVINRRTDSHHGAADERRIRFELCLNFFPGELRQRSAQFRALFGRQFRRRNHPRLA